MHACKIMLSVLRNEVRRRTHPKEWTYWRRKTTRERPVLSGIMNDNSRTGKRWQ